MWVTKLLVSPVKKRTFCPKTTGFCLKLAFLFIAGSFGALLVGWLFVVARGLYFARHLFTFCMYLSFTHFICRQKPSMHFFVAKTIYALRAESFCALNLAIRKVQTFWASANDPINMIQKLTQLEILENNNISQK